MSSSIVTRFHADPDNKVIVGASALTGSVFISLQRGDVDVTLFLTVKQGRRALEQLREAVEEVDTHKRIEAEVGSKTDTQVSRQADARMARDAWSMAVERQRQAEAEMAKAWTMEAMAKAAAAKKAQQAAWRAMDRAEQRAAEA